MKELLNYLFRPSKIDREAVKSAYYGSLKPVHVMMAMAFVIGFLFLIMSFVSPGLFGNTLVQHRICYFVLFFVGLLWSLIAYMSTKDSAYFRLRMS